MKIVTVLLVRLLPQEDGHHSDRQLYIYDDDDDLDDKEEDEDFVS